MTHKSPWGDFQFVNSYPDPDSPPVPEEKALDPGAWGEWQSLQVGAGNAQTEYGGGECRDHRNEHVLRDDLYTCRLGNHPANS